MNADNPLVTILITTYKRPDYLDKCLASVLCQDFKDYEVLILDDDPNGQSEAVVKKYEPLFSIRNRYRYIRNSPHLGYQRSLNRGLREARGKYIARLDDDDTWVDNDKLRRQVEFLHSCPEYVLVGTGRVIVDQHGTELCRNVLPERDDEIREKMLEQNNFVHSSVVFKKSEAMEVGGYVEDKAHFYSEDHILWLKLGTRGKLANLPIYGVAYTAINRGSVFNLQNRLIPAVRHVKVIREYKDKYPHHLRATVLQFVIVVKCLLSIISDVPPFIYLKTTLKTKCPASWRAISFARNVTFQGIAQIIRGISEKLQRLTRN